MSVLPDSVQRYLQKFGAKGPWKLSAFNGTMFNGAVVIPSLAEGDNLFATLESLSGNPITCLEDVLIVIVVNHGEHASVDIVKQNEIDLARLADYAHNSSLNLVWVDAASPGLSIPYKQAGVGFARKLGLDAALQNLDWLHDPLLICLDADTLVEENYLKVVQSHFRNSTLGAAVIPYRHQPGVTAEQQAAIERYEIFLRSYIFGLRLAGSPYAFNSVGSAMACRASAYVRCGGMNTRKAGEDFYFLQKLAKTDGVGRLTGTTVMPSPRVSERVPFGTGRSMARMFEKDYRSTLIYPVEVFQVLGSWIELVTGSLTHDAESLWRSASEISAVLSAYLEQLDWVKIWPVMQDTHQARGGLERAFHVWFDGFKSLRLIHLLCDKSFQRGEPQVMLPEYFSWKGTQCPATLEEILEKLRLDDSRRCC